MFSIRSYIISIITITSLFLYQFVPNLHIINQIPTQFQNKLYDYFQEQHLTSPTSLANEIKIGINNDLNSNCVSLLIQPLNILDHYQNNLIRRSTGLVPICYHKSYLISKDGSILEYPEFLPINTNDIIRCAGLDQEIPRIDPKIVKLTNMVKASQPKPDMFQFNKNIFCRTYIPKMK